jgi:ribonuclease M5
MIKEVVVVEGRHDTIAIKRAVDADTIETGGSRLSKETMQKIKLAHERRGVIILTDPDYAGERIRKIISQEIPGVKHAFIEREEGMKDGDLGVENASPEAIRRALSRLRTSTHDPKPIIQWEDLIDLGLVGGNESSLLRERCGKILGIGFCNAKQFYHRLTLFQISKEEFIAAYEKALKECNHGA